MNEYVFNCLIGFHKKYVSVSELQMSKGECNQISLMWSISVQVLSKLFETTTRHGAKDALMNAQSNDGFKISPWCLHRRVDHSEVNDNTSEDSVESDLCTTVRELAKESAASKSTPRNKSMNGHHIN